MRPSGVLAGIRKDRPSSCGTHRVSRTGGSMTITCDTIGNTDVHRLTELELFAGADGELLATVADRSVGLDIEKGRELVSEGSEAREFVVVLDGHAAVSVGGVPIAYLG